MLPGNPCMWDQRRIAAEQVCACQTHAKQRSQGPTCRPVDVQAGAQDAGLQEGVALDVIPVDAGVRNDRETRSETGAKIDLPADFAVRPPDRAVVIREGSSLCADKARKRWEVESGIGMQQRAMVRCRCILSGN